MFQNIKVDVIYYNTTTDFEMEFDLSGCCRMRLLTDKAPDRKTLVNQLVRAVSRSRIIIMTGGLFGEEGVIKNCSKAINRSLDAVDNKAYGIDGDQEIEIISDSIPLVSTDGIFGGCIIEQGPQTLILLTENKDIRKNIMQNLIHPYIKEVVAGELVETNDEVVPEEQPEIEAQINELADDVVETEVLEDAVAPEEEEVLEPVEETIDKPQEIEETPEETVTESFDYSFINDIIKEKEEVLPEVVSPEDDFVQLDEITESPKEAKKGKNKKSGLKLNIPIIILSCVLILTVAVLCYALFISSESKGVPTGKYIKEIFETLLA
jgi:hypothetical protein